MQLTAVSGNNAHVDFHTRAHLHSRSDTTLSYHHYNKRVGPTQTHPHRYGVQLIEFSGSNTDVNLALQSLVYKPLAVGADPLSLRVYFPLGANQVACRDKQWGVAGCAAMGYTGHASLHLSGVYCTVLDCNGCNAVLYWSPDV
jgi:hypothetical protein